MPVHTVLELKQAVLGYLEREKKRACTCASVAESGTVSYREASARAHEISTVYAVVESIFLKKELELVKAKVEESEERKAS